MDLYEYPYKISPKAKEVVSKMFIVSGSARSGTTILGKLISSAKEIEYGYEPPTVISLISLITEINECHWKMLFETYCYEDLMLGAIAGRNLNFNSNDDSFILNSKQREVIDFRLKTPFTKHQLEHEAVKACLCIKIPDIVPFIPKLQKYYPDIRVIIIIRKANDVLNSVIKKRWYDDVSTNFPDLIWPYRIYKNCKIPFWTEMKDADWWCQASHIERVAYYYLRIMKGLDDIKNRYLINYHELVKQPYIVVRNLFENLSLTSTDKTAEIVSNTAPVKAERYDIVRTLPEFMRKEIFY